MPNKYSHRVVLAHYSSLGLVDLPNDTELLDHAGLSYSAYASRSKKNSRSQDSLALPRAQARASYRHPPRTGPVKIQPLPSRASDSQCQRGYSGVETLPLALPQQSRATVSPGNSTELKTPRQRAAPTRIYLSDDEDLECEPFGSSGYVDGQDGSIYRSTGSQQPLSSNSVRSNRHSVASSLRFELPTESTLAAESQGSQKTTVSSSDGSTSQAASGSIWSNSEQSHTPLTSPIHSSSRSHRDSDLSNSSFQPPDDSKNRGRVNHVSPKLEEAAHLKAEENSFNHESGSRNSSLSHAQKVLSRRGVEGHPYLESSSYEKCALPSAKGQTSGKAVGMKNLMYDGNDRLDSPILSPERELQAGNSKDFTAHQHISRTASEYSTSTQVFKPLPTQPDFDSVSPSKDKLERPEPVGLISATVSYESLPAERSNLPQTSEKLSASKQFPKVYPFDNQTRVKQQKPTSQQRSNGSLMKSYSSVSSLSSLSDFIPSPLLPQSSSRKQIDERPLRSLHHTASVPSLANPNGIFSPSIFEGFEPRSRDDSIPPLPRINLLSHPQARHELETASVSSNTLFPPDIPTSRKHNRSRFSAQETLPSTLASATAPESEPRDLAKAIAEAELKVKTLKQEAAKGSPGKKSGSRLMKKLLSRGKLGD